jgi:hypothetical protein
MIQQLKQAAGAAVGDADTNEDSRWLGLYRTLLLLLFTTMVGGGGWGINLIVDQLKDIQKSLNETAKAAAVTNQTVANLATDVKDIKQTDRDQNVAIGGLDHRVTVLEAGRRSR